MEEHIGVQPLPYKTRKRAFLLLLLTFLASLPFLYLYAIGYRFDLKQPTNLIETGGIFISLDKKGMETFVDDELVRGTRTFQNAFYAQDLDAGTHRVFVQKEGYHTWVKELPVTQHRVTAVSAFNLPLVPTVRVVSPYLSATGTPVVEAVPTFASTTGPVFATSTKLVKTFKQNGEFTSLILHFSTTSTSTQKESVTQQIKELLDEGKASTTEKSIEIATTTVVSGDVKLYESGDDLFATWQGNFEQMPYYYCAPEFPRYSSSTASTTIIEDIVNTVATPVPTPAPQTGQYVGEPVMHPIQTVSKDIACDPTIRIDRKWQTVSQFNFYPKSTDLVIVALDDGIYVVEIDDRSWQNVQPLLQGTGLSFYIENGNIYVYDGELIYQVIIPTE